MPPLLRLLMLWLSVLCCPAQAASEKIVVAAFSFPPIYQDEVSKGVSGDIALAALKASGIEAELRFFPVARMIQTISSGDMACGLGGAVLFERPEVASTVNVHSVIQYVSQGFIYDKRRYPRGIAFSRLDDLAGYRIGVLESSGIMKMLDKNMSLTLELTSTHQGLAKQLATGRIDLWATVDLTGLQQIRELFPSEAEHYTYTGSFNRGDVSFVCSKKLDPRKRYGHLFDKGLAKIKEDGTYLKIMARYYGSKSSINRDSLPHDVARSLP